MKTLRLEKVRWDSRLTHAPRNLLDHRKFQKNTLIWVVTRLKKTIPVTNIGVRSSQQINMRKFLKVWQALQKHPQPPLLPLAMAKGTRAQTLGVNSQDPQVATATGG